MGATVVAIGVMLSSGVAGAQVGERTVIDNERGGYFTLPFGGADAGQWEQFGAADGLRGWYRYDLMPPDAITAVHCRFQHVSSTGDYDVYVAGRDTIDQFQADEIKNGRGPIWVSATYQGTVRPVYFDDYNGGSGGTPGDDRKRLVDVGDERWVTYFLKQVTRRGVQQYVEFARNMPGLGVRMGIGLDNCAFHYDQYGVYNSADVYVPNVTWDRPFAQSNAEFMDDIRFFLRRFKDRAPDVRFIMNGPSTVSSEFVSVMADVDGVIMEEAFADYEYVRWQMPEKAHQFNTCLRDKIQIFQFAGAESNVNSALNRSQYCCYLLARGPNAFYGPKDENSTEIDPLLYAVPKAALGFATDTMQWVRESGKDERFRLYHRYCDGGIVYYNQTGAPKQVTLPPGTWFDHTGSRVSTITIDDMRGEYVTSAQGSRVCWPTVNPRYAGPVTGPIKLALSTAPWTTGATIRYTIDGSTPDERSPVYTDSITVSASAVVKARAFKSGMLASFVNTASYTLTTAIPAVQFHLSADSASEFFRGDFPLVELSHVSAKPVTVSYDVSGGTATAGSDYSLAAGTLTIAAGMRHGCITMPIVADTVAEPWETVVVTLSNPTNATLGTMASYTYTIMDNDGGGPVMAVQGGVVVSRTAAQVASTRLYDLSGRRIASAPLRVECSPGVRVAVGRGNGAGVRIVVSGRAGLVNFDKGD